MSKLVKLNVDKYLVWMEVHQEYIWWLEKVN